MARLSSQPNLRAALNAVRSSTILPPPSSTVETHRRAVADFCRYLAGRQFKPQIEIKSSATNATIDEPTVRLSRRMRQTLERLLLGESEKQIALHLEVSQHTIHGYVKALHKAFDVNSRGELLARFVSTPLIRV